MIKLREDEELVMYTKKKARQRFPSFDMYCNGHYNKHYRRKSMDAAEYLMDLNPKSKKRKVLEYMLKERDKTTNQVTVDLPMSERKRFFYDGVRELVQDEAVAKLSTDKYMINPMLIVCKDNEDATELWDTLEPQTKKEI